MKIISNYVADGQKGRGTVVDLSKDVLIVTI